MPLFTRLLAAAALISCARAETWTYLGELPVAGASDMAYNPPSGTLYVANGSDALQKFSVPLMKSTGSLHVGTKLHGLDISPDYARLAVADTGATRLSLVNLADETVSYFPYVPANGDGGSATVAFTDSNTVYMGAKKLDLGTSTWSAWGSFPYYSNPSVISGNATRTRIAFTDGSSAAGIYNPADQTSRSIGLSWFTYEVACSPDGGQLIVPTYGGAFVYNSYQSTFSLSGTLGTYAYSPPLSACYSPTQPYFFVSYANQYATNYHAIMAYRSDTLAPAGIVEDSASFPWAGNGGFTTGHLRASADGRFLFASTGSGVRVYDISNSIRSVTVSASPPEGGTVSGGGIFAIDATTTVTATPTPGWTFTGWSGASTSTAASLQVNVNTDPALVAHFVQDFDTDHDGYSNAIEIQLGSDPYSAASTPADNDGDFIPDVLDPDDDNDGYLDAEDPQPLVAAQVSGSYFALLPADAGITGGRGGTIELQLSERGAVTGKVHLASGTLSFRGTAAAQVGPDRAIRITVARPRGAALQLDLAAGAGLTGTLAIGGSSIEIDGWKKRYGPGGRSTTGVTGTFNVVIAADPDNAGVVPAGEGFAAITVSANGMITGKGKLPDGSVLTFSSPLGPSLEFAVWALPDSLGTLLGQVGRASGDGNYVLGTLDWWKAASPDPRESVYRSGFGTVDSPIAVQVQGGRYIAPAKGQLMLGLDPGPGNAEIAFGSGGIESARLNPDQSLEIAAGNKAATASSAAANPTRTTLTFDSKTGAFKGSFQLADTLADDELYKRTVKFEGLFIPYVDSGEGFFLLEQLPASKKDKLRTQLSGYVEIRQR